MFNFILTGIQLRLQNNKYNNYFHIREENV